MTNEERIKADAEVYANRYLNGRVNTLEFCIVEEGYIAGATAEHAQNESVRLQLEAQDSNVEILLNQKKELIDRVQVLADFIQEIIDFPPAQSKSAMSEWIDKYRDEGRSLMEQWKGKEVEP